jgi:predicted RNA-binding Zn-ribbon protein involved in translation (DUF1610 family)
MAQGNKMICPECGVEMNYHAEKIDYTAGLEDTGGIDPLFGGVIEEAHSCPLCGQTQMRKAEAAEQGE